MTALHATRAMIGCLKVPATIPEGVMVGMDPIEEGKLFVTIRLSIHLPVEKIQQVYYHRGADDPAIGR